jgi:hypothetical protein
MKIAKLQKQYVCSFPKYTRLRFKLLGIQFQDWVLKHGCKKMELLNYTMQ